MKTGLVESWAVNPFELGPLYPFVGFEVPLLILCVGLYLGFMLWKLRFEASKYAGEEVKLGQGKTLIETVEKNSRPGK